MKIAVDFDGTWDEDPEMFGELVNVIKDFGHDVCVVTGRIERQKKWVEEQVLAHADVDIYYAGVTPKRYYMKERNVEIDVWIDNEPGSIIGIDMEE